MALYDNHGRLINYVRIAVTDRCNLRCFYCMPEEGIHYVPKNELLSYEEMTRLTALLVRMGVEKVRITGGEPFVRRDMMDFLRTLSKMDGLKEIHITTNGTTTAALVPELKSLGIRSVNLSLDSLDRNRFFEITRRDAFPQVMETLDALLQYGIKTKINAVVMEGKNSGDILSMVEMARDKPVSIRFIEEMPFNGSGKPNDLLSWDHRRILEHIRTAHPSIEKIPDPPYSTSYNYKIPGFLGSIGIIAAYSRTFCGTCNRIRITPQGMLKTCLYDDGVFNIRDLMRAGATDTQLQETFLQALGNRSKDGWEAEKNRKFGLPVQESMSTIGG
ncbi:MAG: GTP 3',8-cyclase MoaA [Saprospiraceae bacterium]|jgi:molybdenum cofactor biosynthesis protein A